MARKARSARGEEVDFDLIEIKGQIASAPKTIEVKAREEYVDQKSRRSVNRALAAAARKAKLRAAEADAMDDDEPAEQDEMTVDSKEEPTEATPRKVRRNKS